MLLISCSLRLECADNGISVLEYLLYPFHPLPTASWASKRILVRIYGSPDLFVKEYCNLLADRLLASLSYDVSREVCQCVFSVRLRAHCRCLIPVDTVQCHKLLLYLSVYVRTVGSQPGTVKGSLWGDQPAPVWCNAKGYCRLSQDKWSSVPTHANCELPATAAVHKLCSCAVIYIRTYIRT